MTAPENHSLLAAVNTRKILSRALSRGGQFADVFAEEKASTLIEIEAERLERLVQGRRSGAGVRVIHSFRTAYSYSDLIRTASLFECAAAASLAVPEGCAAAPIPLRRRWQKHSLPVGRPPSGLDVKAKLKLMWRAEKAGRKADPRIRQLKVVYSDQVRRIAVATSEGLLAAGEVTHVIFHVAAVAADETGVQIAHETVGGTRGLEMFDERPMEEVAMAAARRAVQNLTARPAPAGPMTVVIGSSAGGTMIHEAVGHGLEADLAEQGLSVYAGRLGEKVASPLITVRDDATLPGRRGSFNIDDDGFPAQATTLIENGVLQSYLYDRRLAMKMGKQSTGNGRRESYEHPPLVRMTNTMIAPSKTPPEEIIRSVQHGLFVKKMGGGEVNTVNGDFVFEVNEGYLLEGGAIAEPVRGATLTGNGPRVLMEIDLVGSDLGFGMGTCGKDDQSVPIADAQPTLRIPELVVGGRIE